MADKRLYKSQKKIIFGVCGGIADFFKIDPTIVRLIAVILVICGFGTGVLVYIIAGIVMPDAPLDEMNDEEAENLKSANIPEEEAKKSKKSEKKSEENADSDDFDSYFKK